MSGKKTPVWLVVVEILILFGLFLLGDIAVRLLHLPVSPALLGMGILFVLLVTGRVQVHRLKISDRFFVRHMVLLLLPVVVGIVTFGPLLGEEGWKLGFILVISTLAVLMSTALIARWVKKEGDE